MLIFNGRKFARNDKEAVESLFHKGGTVSGFYKVKRVVRGKGGIYLYNLQKELQAYIVIRNLECFVVSASEHEGRKHFMYSTTSMCDKWLGLDTIGYSKKHELCEEACKSLGMFPTA